MKASSGQQEKDPIAAYLRDHLAMCGDLIAEREPQIDMLTIARHHLTLRRRYGEDGLERIHDRSRALVREVYGGEPAPPVAVYQVDRFCVVEADILAEQIAKEYRTRGVRPSTDPDWRSKLQTRFSELVDRHNAQLEQRVAELRKPAPTPAPAPPNVAELVAAEVERVVSERLATRAADSPPPMVYLGIWKPDATYDSGHAVTDRGTLWYAEADGITGRPGKSPGWRMMHKSMEHR